ncbi:MAG: hypothetical protein P8J33_12130 [Pirellulaceae bacterium]|nr:hypothetical protein [Pirellulaceae bacterium]
MRTQKAINDLAQIRQRLQFIDSRSAFRSISLVISAAVFIAAALLQPTLGIELAVPRNFVWFWLVIALACSLGIAMEVGCRSLSGESRITFEWSRHLALAMLPAMVAAALLTWAILDHAMWAPLLPGLWSMFAGLAITSAARLLPSFCQLSAIWMVLGGALAIRFDGFFATHLNLTMVLLFGVGQILLAVGLFAGVTSHE